MFVQSMFVTPVQCHSTFILFYIRFENHMGEFVVKQRDLWVGRGVGSQIIGMGGGWATQWDSGVEA